MFTTITVQSSSIQVGTFFGGPINFDGNEYSCFFNHRTFKATTFRQLVVAMQESFFSIFE